MSVTVKREIREIKILLRSIPSPLVTFFGISVVLMNLLANKSIDLHFPWLALDCGITVSWVSFLCMDIITKHFGPKAATQMSIMAVVLNLIVCTALFIVGALPGTWGEAYNAADSAVVNNALNKTFSGTWYVLLGSTAAFIISAVVNNFTNSAVGKLLHKKEGFVSYAVRTYISTAIGQFVDNFLFALIVSQTFFGWTFIQCVTCALTGMAAEFVCEAVFSPIGYEVCKNWKRDGVGKEYLEMRGVSE